MIRTVAFFGLGITFLMISPSLREALFGAFSGGVHGVEHYAPYSYVALGVVAVGSFVVSVHRGSQPR
jgi:hypothetical protein